MSKAILVMSTMPLTCDVCKFCDKSYNYTDHEETYYCHAIEDGLTCQVDCERDSKCPLKPMPMRKMSESVVYANGKPYQRVNTFTDYDIGWNECIDEILGEEE